MVETIRRYEHRTPKIFLTNNLLRKDYGECNESQSHQICAKCQSYLVSEPNYQTAKCFLKNLLVIETKKMNAKMNKPVYLGLSVMDISKTVMYQYWYD